MHIYVDSYLVFVVTRAEANCCLHLFVLVLFSKSFGPANIKKIELSKFSILLSLLLLLLLLLSKWTYIGV